MKPTDRPVPPRRWGRAGQRLSPEEVRVRDAAAAAQRRRDAHARVADEQVAYRLWRAGQLRPYRITVALDARGLFGPEVDIACGAKEPDVDLWEAGKLYPTWEQVLLLAKLTGNTPRFFFVAEPPVPISATSMRFHMSAQERAIAEAEMPGDGVRPGCGVGNGRQRARRAR